MLWSIPWFSLVNQHTKTIQLLLRFWFSGSPLSSLLSPEQLPRSEELSLLQLSSPSSRQLAKPVTSLPRVVHSRRGSVMAVRKGLLLLALLSPCHSFRAMSRLSCFSSRGSSSSRAGDSSTHDDVCMTALVSSLQLLWLGVAALLLNHSLLSARSARNNDTHSSARRVFLSIALRASWRSRLCSGCNRFCFEALTRDMNVSYC